MRNADFVLEFQLFMNTQLVILMNIHRKLTFNELTPISIIKF